MRHLLELSSVARERSPLFELSKSQSGVPPHSLKLQKAYGYGLQRLAHLGLKPCQVYRHSRAHVC